MIVLKDVITVYFENSLFHFFADFKLVHVVRLLLEISVVVAFIFVGCIILLFYERLDEVFEFALDFRSVDVGSPNHLSGRTHLVACSEVLV